MSALFASSSSSSNAPTVNLTAIPLASILDHHLRRPTEQDRVFGTLLGYRSFGSNQVTVTATLGLPYGFTKDGLLKIDFEDLENDKTMSLLSKALSLGSSSSSSGTSSLPETAQEVTVVGWYTTHPTLNSYTPLIHDRYTSRAGPQAVHLTLDVESLQAKTYTSATGMGSQPQNALFVPVKNKFEAINETERPALDLLLNPLKGAITPQSPLSTFSTLLTQLSSMLDSVLAHVETILNSSDEELEKADPALATFLLDTLGNVVLPSLPSEGEGWEGEMESHLADVMMLSYLSNLAKYQMDLSARLALLPDNKGEGYSGLQQQQQQH